MSDILKSTGGAMPTVASDFYTAPALTTIISLSGGVTNNSGGSVDVTVDIAKSGGSTVSLAAAITLADGETFEFPTKMILEPDDALNGFTTVAGCTWAMNYVEHGDVTVDALTVHQDALAIDGFVELAEDHADAAATSAANAAASAVLADVTKASVEAVLTGEITSHTHPAGGGIDHSDLTGIGTNTHAQIDTFIAGPHAPADAEPHIAPTKAEVEAVLTGEIASHTHALPTHDSLPGSGTNTHAQIDTHLATVHAPSNAEAHIAPTKVEVEAVLTGAIDTHNHPTETVVALGDLGGGTDDIDFSAGTTFTATVSTSAQTFTFSNPPAAGKFGVFILVLFNAASQEITWPASVKWAAGTKPTLTAAGKDILAFSTEDGGVTWDGYTLTEDSK